MSRILALTLLMLFTSCSDKPKYKTNNYTLDFRKGHNLKVLYDAGVRPWIDQNDPYKDINYICYVGNTGFETDKQELDFWTILLPGGEKLTVATDFVSIEVLEDYDIDRIDFRGTVREAKEAALVAKKICEEKNTPIAESAEKMVADSLEDPYGKKQPKVPVESPWWITRSDGVDISLTYWTISTWQGPLGSTSLCLIWLDNQPKDWWNGPIKKTIRGVRPPLGYEKESMKGPWWRGREIL